MDGDEQCAGVIRAADLANTCMVVSSGLAGAGVAPSVQRATCGGPEGDLGARLENPIRGGARALGSISRASPPPVIARILDGADWGERWTGTQRCACACSASWRPRGTGGVDLGGRRQRAVLAALVVMRGQVVPADRLADCVWGGDAARQHHRGDAVLRQPPAPPPAARGRGARRDGVIAAPAPGTLLRLGPRRSTRGASSGRVDAAAGMAPAEAARALDDASQLWRGPAYAEYADEPWAEAEIVRLTELRAVARERLLEARLQLGEAALLVGELEALVAEDPLREERWRLLVLALYRSQRQADALAALRRARETLADELGVDPGPALRALEAEVLAQSPELDAPLPAAPRAAGGRRPAPTVRRADLVDRDRETAALQPRCRRPGGRDGLRPRRGSRRHRQDAAADRGRPPRHRGRRRVLSARGSQLERSFGFGAVRQLFEPVPLRLHAATRCSAVRPPARGRSSRRRGRGGAHGSFAVLHGLYWLTVNLAAEGPLLISVDDVQWCDSASLRYLAYLASGWRGCRLVVMTLRTGEQHADDALLAEIAPEPSATVLRPQPLSAEAPRAGPRAPRRGRRRLRRRVPHHDVWQPAAAAPAAARARGEGVRPDVSHADTVRAVGSRAVSSLVMLRLRRMPPAVTAAARAVAVLGEAAAAEGRRAGRLSEEDAAAALDTLAAARSCATSSRSLCPSAGPRRRLQRPARHRARAAPRTRSPGAPAARRAPEQVAAHLLVAPRRGSAATVAVLRAAARAADRGASDSAALLLRRALEEPALARPAWTCWSSSAWRRRWSTARPAPRICPRRTGYSTTPGSGPRWRWSSPGRTCSCRPPASRRRSPRGGGRGARGARRRAPGPGRAAADDRSHARVAPVGYRDGPAPMVSGTATARGCWRRRSAYELCSTGRTAAGRRARRLRAGR